MSIYEERNRQLIEMRDKNPCMTLQAVGDKYHISRERVRQILVRAKKPTKNYNYRGIKQSCPRCGQPKISKNMYCSKCYHEMHYVPLVCDECGKLFERRQSDVVAHAKDERYKQKLHFCSRFCMGRWAGKNYGFNTLTGYKPIGESYPKYDYKLIAKLYSEGKSHKEICQITKVSESYLCKLITQFHKKGLIGYNRQSPQNKYQFIGEIPLTK